MLHGLHKTSILITKERLRHTMRTNETDTQILGSWRPRKNLSNLLEIETRPCLEMKMKDWKLKEMKLKTARDKTNNDKI